MYYNVKGKVFLKGEIVLIIRAKRTSEHLALALFAGILLYFAHSFLVNEAFIPNEVLRSIASAALSVLQLGVPALMFYAMQKRAGFEEPIVVFSSKKPVGLSPNSLCNSLIADSVSSIWYITPPKIFRILEIALH